MVCAAGQNGFHAANVAVLVDCFLYSDQCKTALDSLCHFSIGQSACLECEKEHVKVLEQAHCTAAEMIAYCKQQTPAAHMLGFLYY